MAISRTGNRDNEFYQIQAELSELDASVSSVDSRVTVLESASGDSGFHKTAVSGAVSPVLADIEHDTTFYNNSGSSQTVTLPSTIGADQVGKRFHFVASPTFSFALVVTCSLVGLLRDESNTAGPFTVTNGTLTITVSEGAGGLRWYSVGGDFT